MKVLFVLAAVLILASVIDAAPKALPGRRQAPASNGKHAPAPHVKHAPSPPGKTQKRKVADKNKRQIPFILPGSPVYPGYYPEPAAPLVDFQSALQAAFLSGVHYAEIEKALKHNGTSSTAKPLPLEAGSDVQNATDLQVRLATPELFGNVNAVNPFLLANSPLPGAKSDKLGNANSSVVALVNPYQSSNVNAVFGPDIAPHYEIHYSPSQGLTLDALPSYAGIGSAVGVAPVGSAVIDPLAFGPEVGPYSGFGVAPGFNSLLSPYPYPYPFLPGFDPKGFKPNGKNGKKGDTTEAPTESTTYTDPLASPSDAPTAESSSEAPSEAPASEASAIGQNSGL